MMRNTSAGVTQLELMVSLAILGLITILTANAMNFTRQALERTRALSVETEHLLARETLRDLIATMPTDYGDAGAQSLFSGDATSLTFQSYDPATGERRTYTLALNDGVLAVNGMILGAEVDDLRISYFGQVEGASSRMWHRAWSEPFRIPHQVKVQFMTSRIMVPNYQKFIIDNSAPAKLFLNIYTTEVKSFSKS